MIKHQLQQQQQQQEREEAQRLARERKEKAIAGPLRQLRIDDVELSDTDFFDRAYGVTPSAAKLIKAVEKKPENQNAAPAAKETNPEQKISSVLPTATASFSASALLDYDTGTWLQVINPQKWEDTINPPAKKSLGPAPQ